ncbi:lipid A export permease/ATP-binding protein MsbA [Gallaecimonas pentaromativorans]|uniref:Subfamily B ATP-binding cassette protein MsbA n=1 Tax=Gallaecimonas pentaromativorans TaxID=584787 RepID=A0A3N1P0N6_9GAMM|nr:lipid A export permease/ATP-binding protein MsbA [Gallaecimonas pentaromativorans]ROQ24822.1 subfamily B ATP-binding cassette protein MsbA [Gallaecimonas pentaromativorans]
MLDTNSSRVDTYKRLLKYAVPFRLGLALAIVGMVANAGFEALFARLMGPFLDTSFGTGQAPADGGAMSPAGDMFMLAPIVVIVLFIARGITSFMADYGLAWVGRHVVKSLRQELFEKIIRFPIKEFDQTTPGTLISKITFDVELVANSVTKALLILVRESAYVLFLVYTMFSYSWQLTLVFFLVIPPIAFSVKFVSRRFRKLGLQIQAAMGRVTAKSEQMVSGNKVMKLFGSEGMEAKRFGDINNHNRQQNMKVLATQGSSDAFIQLLAGIGLALVLYIAGTLAHSGELTVGAFVGLVTTMLMMMRPIKRLTNVNSEMQRGIAAADSIFQVLDKAVEVDDGTLTLAARAKGNIAFKDVTFSYPTKEEPALKNVSFEVPAGKTIALVGRSGSGKTTISSLLTRFYDIDSGCICLDGNDLRQYRLHDLRRQFAVVSQQVYLFNDTIAANIAYGLEGDVSREAIIQAATTAHAMEFIERLPEGLDTVIGENGVMLSGGQRQRIAIARALLRDAPLLILDEATSALDTESERHIQAGLEALQKNRTSLVIAHRLSTIENADQILVLDHGEILEQGTHSELLERDGNYAGLYKMQFGN